MDLWIVAAATGAGYIAKHWQQNLLSREKDGSSDSLEPATHGQPQFVNMFRQIREQTDPLRRLSNTRAGGLDDVLGRNVQELIDYPLDDDGETEDATAGGSYDYNNVLSVDRLEQSVAVPEGQHPRESRESYGRKPGSGDGYYFHRFNRNNKHAKMMPHLYSPQQFEPLSASESFFVDHSYERYDGVEKDGAFTLHNLPHKSAVRPLLVTDGTRVSSRTSSDFEMEVKNGEELPRTVLPNLQMRSVQNVEKPSSTSPSISGDMAPGGSTTHSTGSSDGALFFLGLMIGIMSSVVPSRIQVDRLNEKLKQAMNLVNDLQEELEMKDQLTVKEIDWKASSGESSGRNRTPDEYSSYCDRHESKLDMEKSEAMSKIEAELEAELERLELNMNTTSLDNIHEFVELDPDLEIDVIREDLHLEKLNARQPGALSDSDRNTSETYDELPQTPNFAVSPRELTLRLHRVIESRLQARILELEAALEGTQRRLSALTGSMRRASTGDLAGSWNIRSPSRIDESGGMSIPLL